MVPASKKPVYNWRVVTDLLAISSRVRRALSAVILS